VNASGSCVSSETRTADRILKEFNQSTLDDVGPLGDDQTMAVLNDMNQLQSEHDQFVKSLASRLHAM
jgi:hypothetical protein